MQDLLYTLCAPTTSFMMHCSRVRYLGSALPIRTTVRKGCVRTLAVLAPVEKAAPSSSEARENVATASPLPKQPVTVPQAAASTSGRVVLEKPEELKSSWEHRAWVGGTTLLLAGIFANGLSDAHDASSAAVLAMSVLTSYVAAGEPAHSDGCFMLCFLCLHPQLSPPMTSSV